MMTLDIFKEVSAKIPRRKIFKLFQKIMSEEIEPDIGSRVNLIFTTKGRIRELNKSHRGQDKATDVLSFNIDDRSEAESVFGEIYISADIANKHAKDYGNNFSTELLRLTCHGLLHLLGYDHIKESDASKMQQREQYFMTKLGYN